MSERIKFTGAVERVFNFPESATAYRELAPPDVLAVNQTSSPLGDHASPSSPAHSLERMVRFPLRSTTETQPRLSPRTGCSRKATLSPFGDTRASLTQPDGWKSSFPAGTSRRFC